MKKNTAFSSVIEIYRLTLELTGNYASKFQLSMLFFIIAFVAQGLAFAMFYPLLEAIFASAFDLNSVMFWFGLMTLFSIIFIVAKWKGHDFDYTGNIVEVTHDLRQKLGESLRNMPLEKLNTFKTGDLNSVFASNVEEAVLHTGMVASIFLQIVIVPSVIIIATFFIDWRLALVMSVLIPLAVPLYIWKRKAGIEGKKEFNDANANLEVRLIEYIQGLPVLKSLNLVGKNSVEVSNCIEDVGNVQRKGMNGSIRPQIIMGIFIELVLLITVLTGSLFVQNSTLALVTLAAAVVVIARLTEPLSIFLAITSVFDLMDSAFHRIKEVLRIKPIKIYEPLQTIQSYEIAFNGVDFTYEGQNKRALENISFVIKQNSLTALVGSSGSGKTTITKLLMRYADPQNGQVQIGGSDIKHVYTQELMECISTVFQDVYLFDDTIMNNIKVGDENANDESVFQAAKAANCHDFITKLPLGYETKVGDIGGNLSGGEKQRISIARAILKDAPIVLLDEPTAALDTESELEVQKAVDELVKNKTVIVIAHRLSTVTHADQILVLDDAKAVEKGTHRELMQKQGKYFRMWQAQQRVKEWHNE